MDIYQDMQKYLTLLKLNESKMSEEQFSKYAAELEKLRKIIAAGSNQILFHFCLSGVLVPKNEQPAVINNICLNIKAVFDDEKSKGEMKHLGSILFKTYSLDSFLEAACGLRDRIIYQVYYPYWTSRCRKTEAPGNWAGITGETWYSQILDMYWHEGYHIWVSATDLSWHTCLPPVTEGGHIIK